MNSMRSLRRAMYAASALLLAAIAGPAQAVSSSVVISQIYGAGGNAGALRTNDYVELFNRGTSTVSVAGWSVQYTSATGTSWGSQKVTLNGSLQPGQYYLVQLGSGGAVGAALPAPDASGTFNMSATAGKVALVNSATSLPATVCPLTDPSVVDFVGFGGTANCSETGVATAPASSVSAMLRNANGCTETDSNSADFTTATPAPRNTASPLSVCGGGASAAIVPACPAALAVATGAVMDLPVSASDADNIVNSATIVSGGGTGISLANFTAAAANGASANLRLAFAGTTAAGTYPLAIGFGSDGGQTASCTINISVAALPPTFTPIYTIQGSGATSALTGVRTSRGVITKVNNNGYYLQDGTGDGNAATSDGIFVFTSAAPYASPGQLVQITGTVSEFNTGAATNAATLANTLTEFSNLTNTVFAGTGSITPTAITLPVATTGELERYEGMLVQINTPLTASQNFFQGRYGQVTLSAGGRLVKPTNIYQPGTAAAIAQQDLNERSSLMLDDGTSLQNPNPTPYIGADNTLRAGDTLAAGLTGVIDYGLSTNDTGGLGMYRIHPTSTPVFTRANARTTVPPSVGGNVKVTSFNVLNFFTTFSNGTTAAGGTGAGCAPSNTTADCRGADNSAEFVRQRAKIVQAMAAINADVFGLMEIQNNGSTAAQNLVDALNTALGASTYAVVPTPPTTGTDAIRVAMIYKPATLTLAGAPMSDAAAIHNRPPFAHGFTAGNGAKFSVVVNHFKSKGSCPASATDVDADQGDGQGCWNERRKQQATALLSFIGSVQTAVGDSDVIVIGDLNAYGAEDPVAVLTAAGLVNQVSRFDPAGYSYVFDGEAGYLDHALATPGLSAQTVGATHWHINADEPSIIDYNTEFKQPACATCGPDYFSATPYRASDHDPVVIGLQLAAPAAAQTITFAQPADVALQAGSFSVSASASSGLTVSFATQTPSVCSVSGSTVTPLAIGTCTLQASQAGNAAWLPATPVNRSLAVKNSQTISAAPLPPRTLGSGPFTLAATSSSGLAVVFTSQTPAVCSVSATTLSLLAAGNCQVAANQPGNPTFAAASELVLSFTVSPAGSTAGADGDVPTLPEWGLLLMAALMLGSLTAHKRKRR